MRRSGPVDAKAAARKAALRALARAKRAALKAGVPLSDWEDEFLGSVAERVKTYGRAFGDSEKGDLSRPLSVMQARKLKEIVKKTKGEDAGPKPRFKRRVNPNDRQIAPEIEGEEP